MESSSTFQCIQNGTVVLTADQALEIYKVKLALQKQNRGVKIRGQSVQIAAMYRVSPKTVRDIWNHTTWKPVTHQRGMMEFVLVNQMITQTQQDQGTAHITIIARFLFHDAEL